MESTEIKRLRKDHTLLQATMVSLQSLRSIAEYQAEELQKFDNATMKEAVLTSADDAASAIGRAIDSHLQTMEYIERRIATLRNIAREERFGFRSPKKPKAMATTAKAKKAVISFGEAGKTGNQFKVFLDGQYVGTVRRSKEKYQSGTEVRFTEEALKKRKFVKKDGGLNIEEVARFSRTRFKTWKYGTKSDSFKNFKEAAAALVEEKFPDTKYTF